MNKFFSLLAAMSIVLSSNAQTGGKISGSIKDGGNQKIIDAATITLLKSTDSSWVKAAVTDKEGNFSFENLKNGSYLLLATSIGHAKTYSGPLNISDAQNSIGVGVLQLVPTSKSLKEVVVTSKKQLIERKLDKTIVNVDAAISNAGTTALEVLEKAPGVMVDKDGNISLKGKQGVMIMLDGKPTYLSATELTSMLRNMPSANIDQIEIMTNPSAKYDASGRSGIINIKTKKNKQKGFNGNAALSYSQGVYSSTNNSLNLNYRNGKFNLFTSLGASDRNGFQNLSITRHYKNPDQSLKSVFEQNAREHRMSGNYNAKIGVDYYLDKKTTIGVVLNGTTNPQTQIGFNTSYLKNNLLVTDSIVTANSREDASWKNGGLNLNFRRVLDSAGRELTADLDYINYRSVKDQTFINQSYDPNWVLKSGDRLLGELPSNINIYAAKIDYTHPLKKGGKLEGGLKTSFVSTDNTAGYFNMVNLDKLPDYDKTNQFDYKENINAAYVNYSREWKKWSLQTGLRLENTNYKGHQYGNPMRTDSSFDRSYTSLFPTAYFGYNASEKNQFGLSYGRRINRPDYEDLNPFLYFLDKYTYGAGNPFLSPMFSNVLELSHTYKQFLTTTLNYSHTKDLLNETFEQKGNAIIVRKGNYGYMNDASLSISAQVPITKWWTSILYTEGKYNQFKGKLYGEDLNIDATTFLVNVNNQFKFKNGWSAELSGFYRTKGIEGQIEIMALGQMDLGLQKQLMKNKATLKLNMRNVLNTMNPKGNINFQNTAATFSQTRDNRVGTLSFSYRFGKPIKGIQKRKTGGAGDEQNRVKSGN